MNKLIGLIIFAVLMLGLILFVGFLVTGHSENKRPLDKITAFGMGWYTIENKPIPVVYMDPPQVDDKVDLTQVEFSISGPGSYVATAFVNPQHMSDGVFPRTNNWKKGDEVLIVNVPGKNFAGYAPTYFVIDYRPAGTKAESASK